MQKNHEDINPVFRPNGEKQWFSTWWSSNALNEQAGGAWFADGLIEAPNEDIKSFASCVRQLKLVEVDPQPR